MIFFTGLGQSRLVALLVCDTVNIHEVLVLLDGGITHLLEVLSVDSVLNLYFKVDLLKRNNAAICQEWMRVAIIHVIKAFRAQLIDFASPCEERWLVCNAACTVILDAGVSDFFRTELIHLAGDYGEVFVANELFVHAFLFFQDQVGDKVDLRFLYVEVGTEPLLNYFDVLVGFSGGKDQFTPACRCVQEVCNRVSCPVLREVDHRGESKLRVPDAASFALFNVWSPSLKFPTNAASHLDCSPQDT
jgi:hypothetical protein